MTFSDKESFDSIDRVESWTLFLVYKISCLIDFEHFILSKSLVNMRKVKFVILEVECRMI